jgi:hypothetical protein
MTRHACVLVALLAVALHAGRADADESPAKQVFARAKQLFEERNYVDAIKAFEEAYRLKPHYFVQCSIARCHENINAFIKAAERYRRCLQEGAAETPVGDRVRRSLAKVESKIAWVTVRSPGEGGMIYVDGREVDRAPGKIPLDPGDHVVEVRREGARPARASLTLEIGGSKTVTLVPEPLPQEPVDRPERPRPAPRRKGLHPAWFWTSAALTAAFTATFVALGVQSYKLRSEYEDDPTEEGYNSFIERRRLTNVFVGLAAAAAASGTVLFFFTDFRGQESPQGKASASWGVGLRGTF